MGLVLVVGVEGGLLVKALDYGSKGPGFQSHLQQRFISLLGALSPTPKIEQKVYLRFLQRGREAHPKCWNDEVGRACILD